VKISCGARYGRYVPVWPRGCAERVWLNLPTAAILLLSILELPSQGRWRVGRQLRDVLQRVSERDGGLTESVRQSASGDQRMRTTETTCRRKICPIGVRPRWGDDRRLTGVDGRSLAGVGRPAASTFTTRISGLFATLSRNSSNHR